MASLAILGAFLLRRFSLLRVVISLAGGAVLLAQLGCSGFGPEYYLKLDQQLFAGRFDQADALVAKTQEDYGAKNRVLYGMDRGATLQLLGQYDASNEAFSDAEDEIDRLFTRKLRNEALSFLLNDRELPFEGDAYEQVMLNVAKALNYALQQKWSEALVEARRVDHRLNVIADRTSGGESSYRDDGFARYFTGLLYETAGDLNNALVAYRRAADAYAASRAYTGIGVPFGVRRDLLRTAEALGLTSELDEYRRLYPDVGWKPVREQSDLAQVIVISYNGRAPARTDEFFDVPLSLDAARLVVMSRGYGGGRQQTRAADSLLYGLNGRVVRIARPHLIAQRSTVSSSQVVLSGPSGRHDTRTEPMQNITGMADKALRERMTGLTIRASARAAIKFGIAEAVEQTLLHQARRGDGNRQRDRQQDDLAWVAFAAGALLKTAAAATEEADKRSWRTLPDTIHVARLWVPPGEYQAQIQPNGAYGAFRQVGGPSGPSLSLRAGETRVLFQRVLQ
ncbi:MAG: hypothetical protein U0172_02155 [Nitrospiraceae bacterium]